MLLLVIVFLVIFFGFMAFTGAPYLPSKKSDVERAFSKLYRLSSRDVLVDIGSGDGMVLRIARQYGARAYGYEINPLLVLVSKWLSRGDARVTTYLANFWKKNLPVDTTVVYLFGDDRDIKRMYGYVEKQATILGRSVYLISYGFEVPGQKYRKKHQAHILYQVKPLQSDDELI